MLESVADLLDGGQFNSWRWQEPNALLVGASLDGSEARIGLLNDLDASAATATVPPELEQFQLAATILYIE